MPPPGSRSHTWGARASGLAGEREHYGLKKRPSRPSRFGQRAAQQPPLLLLLVLLSWLAPTCRAAITFSVSAGDTQYTERSAAKAIDPGFTIATDAADKISKAIVTLTAPEGPTLDVMEFQSLGGGLAVIDYIPETKTIELVGSSTADEYQNALRQMTFYNPSSTPEITDRKVAFRLFGLSGVEIVSSAKIKTVRIITVDDTPTLRLTSTSKEYREGDGKIVIDAGISLSDPDTEKLSFASVQISSGYVDGQDGLYLDVDVSAFDPDLSARWNSAAATYNVTGLANSSSYQAVLRSFKFANTDQALLPGNRTIAFTVADQTSTVTAEIVLVVKAVNQAPVLTLSKSSITFKESNLSPMVLDDLLTLTDPDSLDIVNCTITVSSNYVAGLDSLSIPDSTNWNTYITAAYTNETGVLTLAGRAPASIYQAALRTISFMNLGQTTQATRRVTFLASDGVAYSNSVVLSVPVQEVNDLPIMQLNATGMAFDGSLLTLQPALNVSDEDSRTLSSASVTVSTGCTGNVVLQLAAPTTGLTVDTDTLCVLTLTGAAPIATYQEILRSVQLQVTGASTEVERTLSWQVNDGKDWSLVYTHVVYTTDNMNRPIVTSITTAPTSGGTVTITGANFGPVAPMVVSLVSIGTSPCVGVVVTVPFTEITCTVGPGVGTNLAVDVAVRSQVSLTKEIFDYEPPSIASVSLGRTEGDYITITGSNFGPLGPANLVPATSGNVTVNGSPCGSASDPPTVITAHTQIKCKSVAGTGSGKHALVFVKGQGTGTSGNGLFSYAPPSFPAVSYGSFLGNRAGYEMTFHGDNFGPPNTPATVYLTYGSSTAQQTCGNARAVDHTKLRCELNVPATSNAAFSTSYWEGLTWDVTATVDGLTSTNGAGKFAYEAPVLASIDPGIAGLSIWGEQVYVYGRNFGTSNQAFAIDFSANGNTITLDGSNYPSAARCLGGPGTASTVCAPKAVANHVQGCTFVPPAEQVSGVDCSSSSSCMASLNATMTIKITDANGVVKSSNPLAYTYELPYFILINPSYTLAFQFGEYGGSTVSFSVKYGFTTCSFTAADDPYRVYPHLTSYSADGVAITGYTANIQTSSVVVDKTHASSTTPRGNGPSDPVRVDLTLNGFRVLLPDGRLAFRPPTVTSVTPSHYTYGGTVTIQGTGFGSVSGTNWLTDTRHRSDVGIKVCADAGCTSYTPCSNAVVTLEDATSTTQMATCNLGGGVHIGAKVGVIAGYFASDMAAGAVTYTNLPPEIDPPGTNLGPYSLYGTKGYYDGVPGAGGVISIYGKGFGPVGSKVEVRAQGTGTDTGFFACSNPTTVSDSEHGIIRCTMPAGYGIDYTIYVAVYSGASKLETAATCGIGCTTAVPGGYTNCDQICLKYQGPTVTSATPCPTNGGQVTLTGVNFGPPALGTNSHVTSLELNLVDATNITVVSDTTITADYSIEGTGTGYGISILIGRQTYPGDVGATANLFNYAAPTIKGITTSPAWNTVTGLTDKLVFTGTNFGPTPLSNTIAISGTDGGSCVPVAAGSTHFVTTCTYTCATPCVASLQRTISITVGGQSASYTGLYFAGPRIVSTNTISMFGKDLPSVNALTITGVNFGQNTDATGKVTQVEICKYTYSFQCTSSDWMVQSSPNHVAGFEATQVTAEVSPMYGSNFTVRAKFSGGSGASLVEEYAGGGDGLLNFHKPVLYTGVDGYTPTASEMGPYPYLPTTVDKTNPLHKLQLVGQYFGAAGSPGKITGIVWDSDPNLITAAGSQWAVDLPEPTVASGAAAMSFFPPSGVGNSNFSVYFSCDGVFSGDCTVATNYLTLYRDPPGITSVTSASTAGGTVTITGTNFGPVGSDNVDRVIFSGGTSTRFACTGGNVTIHDTQLTCVVPAGVGHQLSPTVTIKGISSQAATGFLTYDGPVVTSVSSPTTGQFGWNDTGPYLNASGTIINFTVPTNMNWVTITGNNFGPTGYFYNSYVQRDNNNAGKVYIGKGSLGLECAQAVVTVYNTEIQCMFSYEGAGAGHDVFFMILGQDSFGSAGGATFVGNGGGGLGAFSYQGPKISAANSVSFLGGDIITISGINFGPTVASLSAGQFLPMSWNDNSTSPIVKVTVGGVDAAGCAVTRSHVEIQCVAPEYTGYGSIGGLAMLLNIEGQTTTATYSFQGPTVTSVSTVSFFGGEVTVTGTNFGALETNIESIIVGGEVQDLVYANPRILVDNAVLVFTAEPSTIGDAKDLLITIKGVTTGSTGDRLVKFEGPKVLAATGGPTSGGVVTITGVNFGPAGQANIQQVSIADQLCTNPTVTSTTTITCRVRAGSGRGYDISVKVGGVVGIGSGVYSYGKPFASAADPMNPPPGSRVTLTGGNFGTIQANIGVTISGLRCTDVVLEVAHTTISCVTPRDTGGNHELMITVNGVVSDPGTYTYAYPNITSVPSIQPAGGNLTIYGENFGPVGSANFPLSMGVTVGQSECYFPYVQEYGVRITCVLPEALTISNGGLWLTSDLCCDGLMPVNVTIDGLKTSKPDAFSFQNAQLHRFSPTFGRSGDQMTLYGAFFGITRSQINVTVGGREVVRYFSFQSNSVGVEIPPGAGPNNTVRLFVVNREATYEFMQHASNFSYLGPTFSTTRSSVPAPTLGGATTIAGNNLGRLGMSSHIDYIYLSNPRTGVVMECEDPVVTTDDRAVTCNVPAGIGGAWDISMSILGQLDDGSGAGRWQYMSPSVTRVSPRLAGPGTTIFVEGANFGLESSYLNVSIVGPGDSEACLGVVCSESRLSIPHLQVVCIVPQSVGANLDIVVSVAGLRSNTSTLSGFSFPNPIIRSVSHAPTSGGVITISGQGFGPGGECYKPYIDSIEIGDELCTDALVLNDGKMTCVAPPGIGKGYDIIVTLRSSSSKNTGFGLFQYAHPNVTKVRPPGTVGGELVILGENFGRVTPDGVEGPLVRVWREQAEIVFGTEEIVITEKTVTECAVTVAHTEIRCVVSEGIGSGYNVRVTAAGLDSLETGFGKMDYASPIVDSVSPNIQNQVGPTTITIVGRNFGSTSAVDQIRIFVDTYEAAASTIRMWDLQTFDHKFELTVTAPSGAGINLPIYVLVAGLVNQPNHFNGWFSYTAPAVLSVTPVPTQGGIATITGVNFGPRNTLVSSVQLGSRMCTEARVTVKDTEIQCNAAPGVGARLDVRLKINADAGSDSLDSGRGKFRYRCPVVTGVSYDQPPFNCENGRCASGPTGQNITIYGNNFGGDLANISVGILSPQTSEDQLRAGEYILWDLLDLEYHPDAPLQPNQNGLYTLRGSIPVGYARERLVVVRVYNQDSLMMCEQPIDVEDLISTPGKFSSMMFSYSRPDILSATSAPTAGGRITVYGRNFGPLGRVAVTLVLVENWKQPPEQIICENHNVTQENSVLECDVGAGEGGALNIWMMAGGQQSGLVRAYSYLAPTLRSINPANVAPGTFVTLLGNNLGADTSLLGIDVYNSRMEFLFTVPRQNVTMASAHSQILFPVPYGAGRQRTFVIKLPAPVGVNVPSRNVLASADNPASELFFNYLPPVMKSVSPAPTAGGVVTITGTGFGAADDRRLSVQTVLLGAEVCADVNVTVDDVEMECRMPSGSGGGYDAFVTVDDQDSEFLFGAYSYAEPVIDAVEPPIAAGGATITLMGNNFGIDARDVSVSLGDQPCRAIALVNLHTELTCVVPQGVSGRDVGIVVTVKGVSNNASQAPVFTYSYLGCTFETALNYNPAATEDDGTCVIEGCMDSSAPNFDPTANQQDDSCVRPPQVIAITLGLPHPDYLLDPAFYDTLVLEDLRLNLGLDSYDRFKILSVREGSTVWEVDLLDEPSAIGQRNDELAQLLLTKVAANTWTNAEELGALLRCEVRDGQSQPINAKASEPRVSAASIAGIAIGGLILILWAVFWRQILRWCAKRCGAGADEEEEEALESTAFANLSKVPNGSIVSKDGAAAQKTRAPAALPAPPKKGAYGGNQIVPHK